jgi:glutathione S-transferase
MKRVSFATDSFMEGCEHLNLDATIEKKKKAAMETFFSRLTDATPDQDNTKFLGQLRKINTELEPCTFVEGGGEPTALDVFIWTALHNAKFYLLSRENYNRVPNITRWYAHIQHLLQGATFNMNPFDINYDPL